MIYENARTLLNVYINGELDAASTIELEKEIGSSPALRQELARLTALQAAAQKAERFAAPSGLSNRVFASLAAPREANRNSVPSWWRAWAIGASAVAAVMLVWAVGATFFAGHRRAGPMEEIVSAHIRSLMADHLTDLPSAERHEVKPWLSNRLDFAPSVRDLSNHGFHLVGGRLDYFQGKPAAAIVYRHRQHIINVFIRPAAAESSASTEEAAERGYNTLKFYHGGMSYGLVSDINSKIFRSLRNYYQVIRKVAAGYCALPREREYALRLGG